jgi:hypothetical protein
MDTTQVDQLLDDLDASDPADAPEVADRVGDELSEMLEADESPGGDPN